MPLPLVALFRRPRLLLPLLFLMLRLALFRSIDTNKGRPHSLLTRAKQRFMAVLQIRKVVTMNIRIQASSPKLQMSRTANPAVMSQCTINPTPMTWPTIVKVPTTRDTLTLGPEDHHLVLRLL